MKILWLLITGVVFMNAVGFVESAKAFNDGKLRHVVLFKFKDDARADQVKIIEDAFKDLSNKIPEIIDFEWGTNISKEGKSQGFTHCFLVTFRDEKSRDVYLPHPDHKAFVELAGPSLEKALVVDYNVEKSVVTEESFDPLGKLRHLVLFKWKEGTLPAQISKNEDALIALPDKINTIKALEWGIDCSVEKLADGFTHSFLLTFKDEMGIKTYLPHPAHKEFGNVIRSSKDKVLVFDYMVKN